MARRIIAAQKKEIAPFEQWLANRSERASGVMHAAWRRYRRDVDVGGAALTQR
ncbi:MAG TPA: hypothetical protein VK910_10525 [Thiobacillus sp.]|nr:hypothetical protein [Thiobacillus sp.]